MILTSWGSSSSKNGHITQKNKTKKISGTALTNDQSKVIQRQLTILSVGCPLRHKKMRLDGKIRLLQRHYIYRQVTSAQKWRPPNKYGDCPTCVHLVDTYNPLSQQLRRALRTHNVNQTCSLYKFIEKLRLCLAEYTHLAHTFKFNDFMR